MVSVPEVVLSVVAVVDVLLVDVLEVELNVSVVVDVAVVVHPASLKTVSKHQSILPSPTRSVKNTG